MKILLGLNASNLYRKSYCGFKAYYGGEYVDPLYMGSFGWYWQRTLTLMKHTVETVMLSKRYTEIEYSSLSCLFGMLYRRSGLNMLHEKIVSNQLYKRALCAKPDLILIDSGQALLPETLKRIKIELKIPLIIWLLDDPVHQEWNNVLRSLQYYDYVFTFDPHYIEEYKKLGARNVRYLPCACDPDIYKTLHDHRDEIYDLTFIGTVTPNRIELLSKLARFDLSIWSWIPRSLIPYPLNLPKYYRGRAFGEDTNNIYNQSKIALNFHHPQSIVATNMRTFEIASSGTFQLVEYKEEIAKLFRIGDEIICFNDADDLIELIHYYLPRSDERKRIAKEAQKRVHSEHTYANRFEEMFVYINSTL